MGQLKDNLTERVTEYLRANCTGEVSLRDAAAYVHLHPAYLSRLYREETGNTFKAELTSLRMERAKALLDQGELKVYEISEKVGYHKPRYFRALFKEHTGMTPAQYREKRR